MSRTAAAGRFIKTHISKQRQRRYHGVEKLRQIAEKEVSS